jgi:hypothetical protein
MLRKYTNNPNEVIISDGLEYYLENFKNLTIDDLKKDVQKSPDKKSRLWIL